MKKPFLRKLLCTIVWLTNEAFDIKDCICQPSPDDNLKIDFKFSHNGFEVRGDSLDMNLREGQKVLVTAILLTAAGHPATYDESSVSWESDNEDVATVTPVTGSKPPQAWVEGKDGSLGEAAIVTFTVDGDPDEGEDQVRTLTRNGIVNVGQGEATDVKDLEFGTPVDVVAESPAPVEEPAAPVDGGDTAAPVTEESAPEIPADPAPADPGSEEAPPNIGSL